MGKGGGGSRTPVEAPDTLRSAQTLVVYDMLSEGEIYGLENNLRDIYINETPVETVAGTNLTGVKADWRTGTQAQLPIDSESSIENETPVSVEVKFGNPIVRTITDSNIDRLRLTLGVLALFSTDTNTGDTGETSVELDIKINGVLRDRVTISGKTRSQYLRSYIIDQLPATPFTVEVDRVTPDSTSQYLENKTLWSSYTEIIDAKLSYPNTAYIRLEFDSEQFSGVPRRNYLIRGIRVRVPTNYDPETRDYNGFWDGSFKTAWTDNPAWIFYDMLTENRYGMGDRIGGIDGVDRETMYEIAQYCDQLVDDGFGGLEPRFTCNCQITDAQQAATLIDSFMSIFRGMKRWDGMKLSATLDRPADPVWSYTNSNVVDGRFVYTSSALKARFTAVEVEYIDQDDAWQKKTEYVSDDAAIARYGLNVKRITAFGCTRRGQAHRYGRWILETSRLERQQVTFSVGREGINNLPGDIIEVADEDYAGVTIGGRLVSVSGDYLQVVLDQDIEVTSGRMSFINEFGAPETVDIVGVGSDKRTVNLASDIPTLKRGSVWILKEGESVEPRLFRCVGIQENSQDGTYTIVAMQHVPEKESIVDSGYVFDPKPGTIFGGDIPPVEHLEIDAISEDESWQLRATWDIPRQYKDLQFECEIVRNNVGAEATLVKRETVSEMAFTTSGVTLGNYTLRVRGKNSLGQLGTITPITFDVAPPKKPVDVIVSADNFQVFLRPVLDAVSAVGTISEYYWGATQQEAIDADPTRYLGRGEVMVHQGLMPDTTYYYAVRTVNPVGRSDFVTAEALTTNNPDGLLAVIGSRLSSPGFYRIQTGDGLFPPDNTYVNNLFESEFGKPPFKDDVLTFYKLDASGLVEVSQSKMFDGNGQWITPALFLDGDLIAEGTIRGNRIVAGAEISAPVITGGSIFAASVTSSGTPPKFTLTTDGILYARGADIAGAITATSGEFQNCIIRENCTILGTLSANQITGDVVSANSYTNYTGNVTRDGNFNTITTLTVQNETESVANVAIVTPTLKFTLVVGTTGNFGGDITVRVVKDGSTTIASDTFSYLQQSTGTGYKTDYSFSLGVVVDQLAVNDLSTHNYAVEVAFATIGALPGHDVKCISQKTIGQIFRQGASWS